VPLARTGTPAALDRLNLASRKARKVVEAAKPVLKVQVALRRSAERGLNQPSYYGCERLPPIPDVDSGLRPALYRFERRTSA
jgi:hypothetical protein